jgi:hypothetical protein
MGQNGPVYLNKTNMLIDIHPSAGAMHAPATWIVRNVAILTRSQIPPKPSSIIPPFDNPNREGAM